MAGIVGVIAPSGVVPVHVLEKSVERLESLGIEVICADQVYSKELFFAGSDEERAWGVWSMLQNPKVGTLWMARGGSGMLRVLPYLDRWTLRSKKKFAHKRIMGFSDGTALLEFARTRWNAEVVHASMLGSDFFPTWKGKDFQETLHFALGGEPQRHFLGRLRVGTLPSSGIRAEVVGGNLAVLVALLGTKFQPDFRGKMVFLEDIAEPYYRIERMLSQLEICGVLDGARAIVLGTFHDCHDVPPALGPGGGPLRPKISDRKWIEEVWGGLAKRLGCPLVTGLPVGHGPEGRRALFLGRKMTLSTKGLRVSLSPW
jgi:muramoyltetrapeptide carboxypeptidase